jgi:hypothetical protein
MLQPNIQVQIPRIGEHLCSQSITGNIINQSVTEVIYRSRHAQVSDQ